ncbi:MAG: thioesterase family protein [Caulobacteraceae bacterium]|nr:thioesterase family protein [Caulobacteraceae bacterium]
MAGGDADKLGIEVWRGGVNTWECDEMGHMNVRFYVVRALEGLVGLAAALGMPKAYAPEAVATLMLREQHIRFLREARPGALLHMRAGVAEIGESDLRLVQALYHSGTGEPAATFVSRLSHVTAADARPFPWPRQVRERAANLMVEVPDYAAPRGLDLGPVDSQASLERARALGIGPIASGAFAPQDCDAFGRMRAEQFIGRISDGIPQLAGEIRAIIAGGAPNPPERFGGAVLEYRLIHFDWPRAGGRFAIHSGLAGADARTQRIVNWMLDPDTGKPWATSMAIAATFDIDARKIVPASPEALARLAAFTTDGLSL